MLFVIYNKVSKMHKIQKKTRYFMLKVLTVIIIPDIVKTITYQVLTVVIVNKTNKK